MPILFTAIPQQTIISLIHCIGYAALIGTLHSHFWWCAAMPLWSTLPIYFFGYKLTWTHQNSQFSQHMVLVVLWISNTCVLDFVSCLWSDQSECMAVFMVLIYGLVQVLFFSVIVIFSSSLSSSSSFCLFLNPHGEVGQSISSSVILGFFVLLVYSAVPALVVSLCPSSVHVVATFAGTVLFPLLCSVPQFFP
jgi:hypothetical protein